jgi:hypothetical protein
MRKNFRPDVSSSGDTVGTLAFHRFTSKTTQGCVTLAFATTRNVDPTAFVRMNSFENRVERNHTNVSCVPSRIKQATGKRRSRVVNFVVVWGGRRRRAVADGGQKRD